MRAFQAAMAIGKQQDRVTMDLPESAQQIHGRRRQRDQPILVALGITDMNPLAVGIDVCHLQSQALAQAQTETVEREKEHLITEGAGRQKKLPSLVHRDDVRQTLGSGRLDQAGSGLRFMQHMGIIELEAVQIELDRTPGMRRLQIGEIIGQLGFGQLINVLIEILANAANGAGVGLYRLGLQSFEF